MTAVLGISALVIVACLVFWAFAVIFIGVKKIPPDTSKRTYW